MTENPIEEVIEKINKVDINKSEAKNVDYQAVLEKICCNDKKRIECKAHFLTADLMAAVCDSLKNSNNAVVANGENFVAELGKHDSCREYITDSNLVFLLVKNLESSDIDVLMQACRALANICFERSEGQKLIVSLGGLKPILRLLENCKVPNSPENDPKFKGNLIGLLLNLIVENEIIHKQDDQSSHENNEAED